LASIAAFALRAHAAPAPLDSAAAVAFLRSNATPVRLEAGALAGAGGDSLRHAAAASRFVLVGEAHGFVESPALSAALFRAMRSGGPAHFVTEAGPVSAQDIERLAREKDPVAAFAAYDRAHPWALPFYTWREEAEMAAGIVRAGGDVWGVDQEFME